MVADTLTFYAAAAVLLCLLMIAYALGFACGMDRQAHQDFERVNRIALLEHIESSQTKNTAGK